MTLQALYDEALGSHRRGDLATAERLYRQLLEAAPAGFFPSLRERIILAAKASPVNRGTEKVA